MPVPVVLTEDEVKKLIGTWRELYSVLYRFQRQHIKRVNTFSHRFTNYGVDGKYGPLTTTALMSIVSA